MCEAGHVKVESLGCPLCLARSVISWGRSNALTRNSCKDCGRTFNALTKRRWRDCARRSCGSTTPARCWREPASPEPHKPELGGDQEKPQHHRSVDSAGRLFDRCGAPGERVLVSSGSSSREGRILKSLTTLATNVVSGRHRSCCSE